MAEGALAVLMILRITFPAAPVAMAAVALETGKQSIITCGVYVCDCVSVCVSYFGRLAAGALLSASLICPRSKVNLREVWGQKSFLPRALLYETRHVMRTTPPFLLEREEGAY